MLTYIFGGACVLVLLLPILSDIGARHTIGIAMYTNEYYLTKEKFLEALAKGEPTVANKNFSGEVLIEGPRGMVPCRWYCACVVEKGRVVRRIV